MKINKISLMLFLPLLWIWSGCKPNQDVKGEDLAAIIIPISEVSEARFEAMHFGSRIEQEHMEARLKKLNEGQELQIREHRKVFAKMLESNFSEDELLELQNLLSNKTYLKMRAILGSDEFVIKALQGAAKVRDSQIVEQGR